jgi:hypothetical protein
MDVAVDQAGGDIQALTLDSLDVPGRSGGKITADDCRNPIVFNLDAGIVHRDRALRRDYGHMFDAKLVGPCAAGSEYSQRHYRCYISSGGHSFLA